MTVLKKNSDLDPLVNVATGDSVNIRDVSDTTNQATGETKGITQRNLIRWVKGADVASASALPLGADGNAFDITGTNAITSINTIGIGTLILLHFDAILTLTHHATNLILPGGTNITTAAGDEGIFYEYDTGKWRCVNYSPAVGSARAGANADITSLESLSGAQTIPTINLTGGQIAFPATAVPSADPNTLDDYEEGEVTVGFTVGSGTVTINGTYDTLAYTKNGRDVHIQGYLQVSSVSSPSGTLAIITLPFTSAVLTDNAGFAGVCIAPDGLTGAVESVKGIITENSIAINLYEFTGTGLAGLADHMQANTALYISATYTAT